MPSHMTQKHDVLRGPFSRSSKIIRWIKCQEVLSARGMFYMMIVVGESFDTCDSQNDATRTHY